MNWNSVPKEEPSIIFPEGAILEDVKGKYKVLKMEKQDKVHKYTVEVLEQKIPIPDRLKFFIDDKIQTLIVLAHNLSNIQRIE